MGAFIREQDLVSIQLSFYLDSKFHCARWWGPCV